MDKLKMKTPNKADENFEKLAAMFPNAVTETIDANGEVVRAIDKDVLMQEISCKVVEGREERYQFTWPDKKRSILTANAPINKTLRPCREESVDFDKTENLYIEGDNLEVLKLLQETYLGKIKMIYIDPPYNTGNDFVYNDEFEMSNEEWKNASGNFDDEGNQLAGKFEKNTENNGRFHTDWLNMIYPRLKLARDLLTEDGVIFISIDDNEVENLKKICNELFGECNFQGHIHWRRRHNQPNDKTKMIGLVAEHILAYSRNNEYLKEVGVGKVELTANFTNPDNDSRGAWASKPWKVGSDQSGSRYIIKGPDGSIYNEEWMGEEDTFKELLADNKIIFTKDGQGLPRKKYFKYERQEEGQCATNWWNHELFGHNQGANDCLTELFGLKNIFSNPKPIELMKGLLQIGNVKNNDIVLDFFSGSASLAHAVMKMNNEVQIHISYIMIQLPENLDESLKAADSKTKKKIEQAINFLNFIDKPHTICEIGKERIRRAGTKIRNELITIRNQKLEMSNGMDNSSLDIGFRVLKCDSSNMKDVYYNPDAYDSTQLNLLTDNIKDDRTPEDLLFQVMLELGIPLSSKIISIKEQVGDGNYTYYDVAEGYLVACFDENISDDFVKTIAEKHPYYAVFRDSSMESDSVMTNFEQIFASISPTTVRKVL